jgi:hypothetical protein
MATNEPRYVDVSEAGRKGGKARAENMTKAERSASARAAVQARWDRVRAEKAAQEKGTKKKAAPKKGKTQ